MYFTPNEQDVFLAISSLIVISEFFKDFYRYGIIIKTNKLYKKTNIDIIKKEEENNCLIGQLMLASFSGWMFVLLVVKNEIC